MMMLRKKDMATLNNLITWTWDTKDNPAASMVKRSPCKDQICKPGIEVLASKEIELTVEGTKLDKAIPPALQFNIDKYRKRYNRKCSKKRNF